MSWTILVVTLLCNVEMSGFFSGMLIMLTLLYWFAHFTQKVYGMPVDIFEYYRREDDSTELPVEP